MRLLRLRIGRFHKERDLQIEFPPGAGDPSLSFLIGPNGVGKSRVLEVMGRIYSHLSAATPAGLDYDLEYELRDRRVLITTQPPPFAANATRIDQIEAWMAVAERGERWRPSHLLDRLPDLETMLPFRVIGLSTGPTSRLDWALRNALQDTSAQRIGGLINTVAPSDSPEERESRAEEEQAERQRLLKTVEGEERCIALSQDELVLAVLALLSHPAIDSPDEIRDELLDRIGLDQASLRVFTFEVPPNWRLGLQIAHQQQFEELLGRAARRIALDEGSPEDEAVDRRQRTVYEISPSLKAWIGKTADSPFVWFNQLLKWLQAGAIGSVRLVLKKRGEQRLLLDRDFSDGEFLFTGRYGLLRMLQGYKDCLVLFDEPETHFNDRWKVDLVYDLQKVLAGGSTHVVIATHSDLTLTDAHRSEVLMLTEHPEGSTEQLGQPPLSPLAANRNEITRQIFGASHSSGRRGLEVVEKALESGDPEQIEAAIETVGPGYHQFELQRALSEKERER